VKILTLNYEYPPLGGGSSPVTRRLAQALVKRGHEVDVVTTGYKDLPKLEDDRGVRVMRVAALRSRPDMSYLPELASYVAAGLVRTHRLVRSNDYDVCHAHFMLPTGLIPYALSCLSAFPPYVVTVHGSDMPMYNPDRFNRVHRTTPPLLRRIARRGKAIVAPSSAMVNLIREQLGGLDDKLIRIPYGIDLDGLRPAAKESRVLVAARLFERKGVSAVIDAMSGISTNGFSLDIAGDGPQRGNLEADSHKRGVRPSFHGWLDRHRMNELFAKSRIFVLATSIDNFPSSLLEAMAAGCAIVTTRAGGCPEVVGDAALLVDPGDVQALRDSLASLMRDPDLCARLGARARARAEREFNWDSIAVRHEELYRSACAASSHVGETRSYPARHRCPRPFSRGKR
jgi:glycosyltransferase involved in cell wall biosynthesis